MPVLVKICGLTRVEDAVAAARFGADFIGLNFYAGSPRCISEGQARLIMQALPQSVTPIGLFVNEPWEQIDEVTKRLGLTMVQVHGDELTPCPIWDLGWVPAFPIRDESSFAAMRKLGLSIPGVGTDPIAVLVDTHVPGVFGGTGQTGPWSLLGSRLAVSPPPRPGKVILAGGLTPDNVAEAIRIVRPWAVDVASGVESSPGIKDHSKMRRFIEAAKSV